MHAASSGKQAELFVCERDISSWLDLGVPVKGVIDAIVVMLHTPSKASHAS